MADNSYQPPGATTPLPKKPRIARFGDNREAMDYDLNLAAFETDADLKQRQPRQNVGYAHMKRKG